MILTVTKITVIRQLVAAVTLVVAIALPARADDSPPRDVVEHLHAGLIDAMKAGKAVAFQVRYQRLDPVIARAFNLPLMTRLSVGSGWTGLTDMQKAGLTEAFHRFSVATYASRFASYDGERFEAGSDTLATQNGTIVHGAIVDKEGERVPLDYLLRQYDAEWRIIDVFLSGSISELAARRNEFSAVVQSQGPDGLIKLLDQKTDTLSKAP